MPGSGRHRRRIRVALPFAAAGIAAAVTAAVMTTSASASTAPPTPTTKPAVTQPSQATLEQRIAGASGTGTSDQTTTSSGAVSPKIIGGSETTISSAPWMAQLWYYDDRGTSDTSDDIGFFCGGSVVSPTKILTASHCVKGFSWSKNGAVVTGTDQLPTTDSTGTTDLHGGQATGVLRQWSHPSYNATTIDNDIAVLTLDVPVKATPIRMTTSGDTASYAAGTSATLYGWGRTSSTSQDISQTLKTATLPIQSDTTCSGYYGTEFLKGHMVCAGNPASGSDSGTTTACNGDSGGPLVVKDSSGAKRIVGVVSWGVQDCVTKGAYSVFSKVTTYVGAAYPQIDDGNLSYYDGKADLFVRNASTKTGYEKDSKGTSFGSRISLGDWGGVNTVLTTDLNRDGYQDFIYRVSSTGDVYWDHFVLNSARTDGSWASTKIFGGWGTRKRIIVPGDLTGDYKPDLLSVDSGGTMWLYPGNANGTFGSRVSVGTGWLQYNSVRGHGDFTGDGRADLIARQASTGDVYLYKGTGKSGSGAFASRIKVRSAWTGYNAFDAVGDVTGDGKADFLARTPGGTLYLYPGTGKATSEIFASRISVGTGFQQYDLWG
ncbi:trypsin-like serine protease [Streptomyces sp. NK08204]|uniref:trypsin-like serine protease n=1 Tax=Streptomyces sp. NK08204 TaxID=2873260 RepID=UPI001CEC92D1|nr:trypsin-like serine protease [Streptomyces sp. NK08204]